MLYAVVKTDGMRGRTVALFVAGGADQSVSAMEWIVWIGVWTVQNQ